MTITEKAINAKTLWEMLLPHVAAPEPKQFILWVARFETSLIEKVFMKLQRKFPEGTTETAERIHRYSTGLLVNLEVEAMGEFKKSAMTTATAATVTVETEQSWNR